MRGQQSSIKFCFAKILWAGIAQSVYRTATNGRSGDGIPVRVRFSAPVQPTQPPVQQARVPFTGTERPERGVAHSSLFGPEAKERVEPHLYTLSVPSWPVLG
jgi:hypothetical protein